MNAEKGFIQDMMSYLIFGIILIFMLSSVVLFSNLSDNDHFSKYSSDVFERFGNCNTQAMNEISLYSDTRYNGRYKITSCKVEGSGFGSVIKYQATGKFSLVFIDTPFNLRFGGTSTVVKRTYK